MTLRFSARIGGGHPGMALPDLAEGARQDAQAEGMIAPRILGIAKKGWEPAGHTDGWALGALARVYGPLFDQIRWRWDRGA